MAGSQNIIRKQTLEFHFNGKADGFVLQKEVSDWCNFTLIPEIEQQLEVFGTTEDFLRIDKLEIEAAVNSNDWKQKIRDELIFDLKEKLSDFKPISSEKKEIAKIKSAKLDELIIFYFKTGYLPWWGNVLLEGDFKTVFRNWITLEISLERAEFIRGQLEQIVSQKVVERIVNQVQEELFFQFLKNIYREYSEIFIQYESFFEEFIQNNISLEEKKIITKTAHVLILQTVIKNKGRIESGAILLPLYKALKALKVSPEILIPQTEGVKKITNAVEKSWHELLGKLSENESVKINNEIEKISKENQFIDNKTLDKFTDLEKVDENNDEIEAELQEGIFIDNAGAVIFAAFIPTLFEKLGLIENGQIVNPDLAALIIQYCVSGQTQIEEYELVLPKILCGLDIDFPVNTNIEITEIHMTEVNSMLQSLIDYWSALKDTSVEGLRESFLVRNGKLSLIENEWLLVVEQKAFDILLDQIPWSFSLIKFPWMESLLKTEWV